MLLTPLPIVQFLNNSGAVVAGGKLFTYLAGTTTKQATYTDSTGSTPNTNPVVLDASGRANVWLDPAKAYKFVFSPSTDTDPPTNPFWTVDNITANAALGSWAIAGGTADAITATFAPPNTSLTDGLLLAFRASAANATTTPSFAPDGLPAHTITRSGGSPVNIGDIAGNLAEYFIRYNLANTRWELLNPSKPLIQTTKGDLITYSTQPVRKAVGSDGSVLMADAAQTDGLAYNPVVFNWKNRLINPDGRIYARDAAATADDVYFANNWYILTQTNTVTPSVLTDPEDGFPRGVRITQSQAVAQRFGFAQIIEGMYCKDLRGQSGVMVPRVRISSSQAVRYAILGWTSTEDSVTSDVVLDWTSASYTAGGFFLAANLSVIAVGSQTPAANTWTSLTALTAALGSTFNNIVIFVWTEGTAAQNVTLDFDYVQFERGSVATAFERRPFTTEDLMCQRYLPYFITSGAGDLDIGNGVSNSNNQCQVFYRFKVTARAGIGGVTISSSAHFGCTDGGGNAFSSNSLGYGTASNEGILFNLGVAATPLTQGQGGRFLSRSASAKFYCTGAEL